MNCPYCGFENNDTAKFCKHCGKPLNQQPAAPNPAPDPRNNTIANGNGNAARGSGKKIVIILVIVIIILAAFVGLFFYMYLTQSDSSDSDSGFIGRLFNRDKDEEDDDDEDDDYSARSSSSASSSSSVSDDSSSSSSVSSSSSSSSSSSEEDEDQQDTPSFNINPDAVEDFANGLDSSDYDYYSSDVVSDFTFAYPTDIYNEVEYYTDPNVESVFSFGQNEENISFSGSNFGILTYQTLKIDRSSKSDSEWISTIKSDLSFGTDVNVLLNKKKGKNLYLVITGRLEGRLYYSVATVEGNEVKSMYMVFDDFNGTTDTDQKSYVTEYLYRSCSFSYIDKGPRSYDDYLKAVHK